LEKLLLVAGVAALDIWIWSNAATSVFQSWQAHVFDRVTHEIQEAHRAPVGPKAPEVAAGGIVGRLTIPRVNVSAMVREGDDERTLGVALGHIPNTAFPDQIGNVAVAGHRDTLFRGLRYVRKDDLIQFQTLRGTYTYRVESTQVVSPREVEVLNASAKPQLTLVTCYPFNFVGAAPDRFIVKASLVTPEPPKPLKNAKFAGKRRSKPQMTAD
jgi:sortase A